MGERAASGRTSSEHEHEYEHEYEHEHEHEYEHEYEYEYEHEYEHGNEHTLPISTTTACPRGAGRCLNTCWDQHTAANQACTRRHTRPPNSAKPNIPSASVAGSGIGT